MKESFAIAAARHWNDASLLFKESRFANSGYLAGYAVECSLKALVAWTHIRPKSLSHNIEAISQDVLPLATILTPSLGRYGVPESEEVDHVMAIWRPELRYADNAQPDEPTAQMWLHAAEQAYLAIVVKLILDGQESD